MECGIHFAYNYLFIHSVLILYTNSSCIHNFYDVHFLQIRMFVYKMYNIIQNVSIKNVSCIWTKFCIFFVYNFQLPQFLILHTKYIQKFVELWMNTFCIHFIYISCIQILFNFCIQNVYTIFAWAIHFRNFSNETALPYSIIS